MFMEVNKHTQPQQAGFALLITIIVVGVILSVGLSVLDLSIKQVRLSSNAAASEISFHAANAGAECARYWRRASSSDMVIGNAISPVCFEGNAIVSPVLQIPAGSESDTTPVVVGDGEAFEYNYEFTWGSNSRCTQINTIVASSSPFGAGATTTNMNQLVDGYPEAAVDFFCDAGSQCTIISVKGYNKPCNTIDGYGTVQREVLLQY
jgi:hypothetical protein